MELTNSFIIQLELSLALFTLEVGHPLRMNIEVSFTITKINLVGRKRLKLPSRSRSFITVTSNLLLSTDPVMKPRIAPKNLSPFLTSSSCRLVLFIDIYNERIYKQQCCQFRIMVRRCWTPNTNYWSTKWITGSWTMRRPIWVCRPPGYNFRISVRRSPPHRDWL